MKSYHKVHFLSVLIVLVATGTWAITGCEGYTRWPNTKLEHADAPISKAEDDLMTDIGFETGEENADVPEIESRFAFGLVPGGLGPMHLLSISSAVALAICISTGSELVRYTTKSK